METSPDNVSGFLARFTASHPDQPDFIRTVQDTLDKLGAMLVRHPEYLSRGVLERLAEPERSLTFRVPWVDDANRVRVNRGYRVEFNGTLGPFSGGLRFHPAVSLGMLNALGFEQTLTASLSTLDLGGAAGGTDFDPKGKSDGEVMRFCQSFVNEFYRHVSPAGEIIMADIGVGGRELGYIRGQFKRLRSASSSSSAGQVPGFGAGSRQSEARGHGCVYYAAEMLATQEESFQGKRVAVSGTGLTARAAAEKVRHLGGIVVTLSDSNGYVIDERGIDGNKLDYLDELKIHGKGSLEEYAANFTTSEFHASADMWKKVRCDVAIPAATQNELDADDARVLHANGCRYVCEAASRAATAEAVAIFRENGILYAPSRASGAGSLILTAVEAAQGATRVSWSPEKVDRRLREAMRKIHGICLHTADSYGVPGNYVTGASIAAFVRVADAMLAQGVV